MSPSNRLEQEEEYRTAISILEDLEALKFDGNSFSRDQLDVINSIEVEFGKCIEALIARKEALIHEVNAKFKIKRDLMIAQHMQIQGAIESCKKLLDAGAAMYPLNAAVAKESWRVASKLRCATVPLGSIDIKFTPMKDIDNYGTVVASFESSSSDSQVLGGLITSENQQVINSWLPRKNLTLLYRATRDGYAAQTFHKMTDNKGPTLTIIRSHPHNYLFGGYTAESWAGKGWKTASESFIFTLSNPHGIPPTKYPVAKPNAAVLCNPLHGPCFGKDIYVSSCSNGTRSSLIEFPYSYVDTTGKAQATFVGDKHFTASEIEVYSVDN